MRGPLCAGVDHPAGLVATWALDGTGGGAFDAPLPLVLADVTRDSGRYSAARGMVGIVQGVGGSLGNAVAGAIVVGTGYRAAFLALAVVALAAFLLVRPRCRRPASGGRHAPARYSYTDRDGSAV